MSTKRACGLSLLIVIVLWVIFSWPLPLHMSSGIPASAKNVEKNSLRTMIPGDHLQLLYHFWLAGDMLAGKTPALYNVYEFNTGDDAGTFRPHLYFLPFSLIYAVLSWLCGRALAWNITGLLSLWMTYFFTFLFVRRYTREDVAWVAALVGLLMPFRWITLLGGSPTGYGIMWIPALFLGLDIAVRESRIRGGFLAGAALLLARFSDSHLLFFGMLAAPAWCVIAMVNRPDFEWKNVRAYLRLALALLPVPLLSGLALLYSKLTHYRISESLMAGGRSISEVALFTPRWQGLFAWKGVEAISKHIYIGHIIPVIIAAGILLLFGRIVLHKSKTVRPVLSLVLLALGMTGISLLAIGVYGPSGGRIFTLARRFIPFYEMIRQPAKIFCLAGTLLSVAVGLSIAALALATRKRRVRVALLTGIACAIIVDFRICIKPTICTLDHEQPAYRAVAEDAASVGIEPRILVIPLWPGDSAWSSVYEYFVSLYRIRMVNGYNPVVPRVYFNEIFERFVSANKGVLDDDQLDELLDRGIRYVLVHEDLFPEKVSPFPISFTLQRFQDNLRIELFTQAGPVWAFRILEEPGPNAAFQESCDVICSARRWEVEDGRHTGEGIRDTTVGGNEFVRLAANGSHIGTRTTSAPPAPNLRWLVRARGAGTVLLTTGVGKKPLPSKKLRVPTDDWAWFELPFDLATHERVGLRLDHMKGSVDVDMVVLAAGHWRSPRPGKEIVFPASCFFHAGYTDRETGRVVLRRSHEPDAIVFYGPKLPLDIGTYDVEMVFSSDARPGTVLGQFNLRRDEKDEQGWVPVVAGSPAKHRFVQPSNLPFFLAFLFERNADIEIESVVLTRID